MLVLFYLVLTFIFRKSLYVIESKNYTGEIIGDKNTTNWVQKLSNERSRMFYSPVLQNNYHINVLQSILPNVSKDCYFSCIVFSERCELKYVEYNNNYCVTKRSKLISYIKKQIKHAVPVFDNKQIQFIYDELKKYTNVSEKIKKLHIQKIEVGLAETLRDDNCNLNIEYERIVSELKAYRKNISYKIHVSETNIFSDETIYMLANIRPECIDDLVLIKGMSKRRIKKYGKNIIDIINP